MTCAEWDDSESCIRSNQSLEHIVNCAVATAGNDGLEAVANCHADLGGSVGRCLGGCNLHLDACSSQDRNRRFHVFDAVLFSSTRQRVVKECGFAHENKEMQSGRRRAVIPQFYFDDSELTCGLLTGNEFSAQGSRRRNMRRIQYPAAAAICLSVWPLMMWPRE